MRTTTKERDESREMPTLRMNLDILADLEDAVRLLEQVERHHVPEDVCGECLSAIRAFLREPTPDDDAGGEAWQN